MTGWRSTGFGRSVIGLRCHKQGAFSRRAPGIQINVPAISPNAFPLSYRAWGALFTVAEAHVIHA